MSREKLRGEIIFDIIHCPYEGRADMYHEIQTDGPASHCKLSDSPSDQHPISKTAYPLILPTIFAPS